MLSRVDSAWEALFWPRAKTPHKPPALPQQQLHPTAGAGGLLLFGLKSTTGHWLSVQLTCLHSLRGVRAESFPILTVGPKLRGPCLLESSPAHIWDAS